ncbi:MAG: uncharacterized protein JWO87_834 [Phycisphaerales bacterium]|nr:uncharacterized protein [Phycisphaerales bacterium]MDB5305451.1 uncharacterized protein [Phycisphaerales bacterium]
MTAIGLNMPYDPLRAVYPGTLAPQEPEQPISSTNEVIARLNAFLHGEIAAAETYRLTLQRLEGSGEIVTYRGVLRQFQEEHELAADVLRQFIDELGGEVLDQSGSWGVWAGAVQCSKGLFDLAGTGAATMDRLMAAEQAAFETYVAHQNGLPEEAATFLRDQLAPAQRRHAKMLRELLGETDAS